MTLDVYAPPQDIRSPADCYFHHTIDLPGGEVIEGNWDLRGAVGRYIGNVSVRGKRVLDVGAASGFVSFEMEKMGADVVSFDPESGESMTRLPFKESLYTKNRAEWGRGINAHLERLKNSYWFTHRLYGSKAKAIWGNVYDLPDELGLFDIVVAGQILVHLSDPVAGLSSMARRSRGMLVITDYIMDFDDRMMRLCADPETGPDYSWWQLSRGLYQAILGMIGFEIVKITEGRFKCNQMRELALVNTLVAQRDPASEAGKGFGLW
jgi:SAM-dependent methyltransferase